MREKSTLELAQMLVRVATGEEYGDGYTVTDLAVGYAERGYGNDQSVVVFGNWNTKRFPRDGDPALTKFESLPARLASALEKIGAECEWLDEWTRCGDCYRAMRTQPDSYSWKMSGAFVEDACEYFCTDCLLKDLESSVTSYEDNPHNAITWLRTGHELEDIGYVQWEEHNPHTYESGWHPGQNDNPEKITEEIRRYHMHASIVFVIDSTSQFDMRFSAWVKFDQEDEEENDRDEEHEDANGCCECGGNHTCQDCPTFRDEAAEG